MRLIGQRDPKFNTQYMYTRERTQRCERSPTSPKQKKKSNNGLKVLNLEYEYIIRHKTLKSIKNEVSDISLESKVKVAHVPYKWAISRTQLKGK